MYTLYLQLVLRSSLSKMRPRSYPPDLQSVSNLFPIKVQNFFSPTSIYFVLCFGLNLAQSQFHHTKEGFAKNRAAHLRLTQHAVDEDDRHLTDLES